MSNYGHFVVIYLNLIYIWLLKTKSSECRLFNFVIDNSNEFKRNMLKF